MNNENLFVALVFYSLRWCGLFGQNSLPLQRFVSIAASYNNDVSSNVES